MITHVQVQVLSLAPNKSIVSGYSAVGSALVWGARGREFKSRYSDQINKHRFENGAFFKKKTAVFNGNISELLF